MNAALMSPELNDFLAQLDGVRKKGGSGGYVARCPAHNDHSPSLSIDEGVGGKILVHCFSGCSFSEIAAAVAIPREARSFHALPAAKPEPAPVMLGLNDIMLDLQCELPGSPGEEYFASRGISLDLALRAGCGYAAPGQWPHFSDGKLVRQSPHGRVVFPHTTPSGVIVNLYGRAIRPRSKADKHDHLAGNKGAFNGSAIATARNQCGSLYLVEGSFDAISLMALGIENVTGIFGLSGIHWAWFRKVRELILGLDADRAGTQASLELMREATKKAGIPLVRRIPASAFEGGAKDLSEALVYGSLERWLRS